MQNVVGVSGNRFKRLRLGKGLTQIELARMAGVSPDTIVRWEHGKGTNPHPRQLVKLAKALEVTPDDLLED